MKRLFSLVSIVVLCIVATSFQSCKEDGNGGKYTIWTDVMAYTDFENSFKTTLTDGYYKRVEISDEDWKKIGPNLTSEGRHSWDEATIKKWFISNGFGEYEATKESSWFVVINHGFIASRVDNLVYLIVK